MAAGVFCVYALYYGLLVLEHYLPVKLMPAVLGAGREPLWPIFGVVFFGGFALLCIAGSAWRFSPGTGRRHALTFGTVLVLECIIVALRVHYITMISEWGAALEVAHSRIAVG